MKQGLALRIASKAKVVKRGDDFFVKPLVKNLEFKVLIKELKPASLAGGKELITEILNTAYKKRKKSILKAVNVALVEKKLPL
jgi:hypothetical protein